MKSRIYFSNFITVLKLPVYFISDNHFKMDINKSEKDRRKKLYHVFDKIKSSGGTLIIGGDFNFRLDLDICTEDDFLKSSFTSSSSKKLLMIDLRKILLASMMFNGNVTL